MTRKTHPHPHPHPDAARGSPEDECPEHPPTVHRKRNRLFKFFRKKDQGQEDVHEEIEPARSRRSGDTMFTYPSALSDVEEIPPAMKVLFP